MSDTPKKTLTLSRKPATDTTGTTSASGKVSRTGKRIIRRDDLPNVQRPGQGKPKPTGKAATRKKPPRKPNPKKPVISPSELKARELNDRLNGFKVWREYLPLAIGIDKDVFRLVNDEHFPGASKNVVQKVLAMHTHHGRYLESVIKGWERYRLDGATDGIVVAEQQNLAKEQLAKQQENK